MTTPSKDKVCKKCGKVKPIAEFYTSRTRTGQAYSPCKVCTRAAAAKYRTEHYEEAMSKQRVAMKIKRAMIKDAVFNAYGGWKCACCGETEKLFLTLDHINNDGAAFRKSFKNSSQARNGGYTTYKWLMDHGFPEGYQVLCSNCNHGKRMNNGICPHKTLSVCNDQPVMGVGPSGSKRGGSLSLEQDMICSASKDAAVSERDGLRLAI